jgi:hypothetical protein
MSFGSSWFFLFMTFVLIQAQTSTENVVCQLNSQHGSCRTVWDGTFHKCQTGDGTWLRVGFSPDSTVFFVTSTQDPYTNGYFSGTYLNNNTIFPGWQTQAVLNTNSENHCGNPKTDNFRDLIFVNVSNPSFWYFSISGGEFCQIPRSQSLCKTSDTSILILHNTICPYPYFMSLQVTKNGQHISTGCIVHWNDQVYVYSVIGCTNGSWIDKIGVSC